MAYDSGLKVPVPLSSRPLSSSELIQVDDCDPDEVPGSALVDAT